MQKHSIKKSNLSLQENYLIKNCPGWKLKSKKIYHDSENKTIHYDHAQIQLFNIPVFYLPYFSHPDPSVKKRSGFLMPTIQTDKQLGETFSIPIFFGLKETNFNETKTESIFVTLKTILWDNKLTDTAKFLIARMFYADGLVVLVTGGGVYAVGVHNYSFKELVILSVVGNLIAGIFSFWGGFLNDKYGSKKVISFSILGLMFGVFCMVLTQNKIQFFVAAMLVATIVGPLQSASRVLMSNIIPEENKGSGFGLFTFAGRSTAFIGPLLVGTVTYFVSQRVGLLAVLPLFIVGFVILKKLKLDDSY